MGCPGQGLPSMLAITAAITASTAALMLICPVLMSKFTLTKAAADNKLGVQIWIDSVTLHELGVIDLVWWCCPGTDTYPVGEPGRQEQRWMIQRAKSLS
jgi:hypothetical protein